MRVLPVENPACADFEEYEEVPKTIPLDFTEDDISWVGDATPPEENADLPGFTPESAQLLLQGVYGDFPHHNDGAHLDGESQTTLHESVASAGLLPSQRAGMPRPLERWGAASRRSWRRNGGG